MGICQIFGVSCEGPEGVKWELPTFLAGKNGISCIIVRNTSKTYYYSLFHPEGIFSNLLLPEDSFWMK